MKGFQTACYTKRQQSPVNRGFKSEGIPDCVLQRRQSPAHRGFKRDSGLRVTYPVPNRPCGLCGRKATLSDACYTQVTPLPAPQSFK